MKTALLHSDQIQEALNSLPEWAIEGNKIVRLVKYPYLKNEPSPFMKGLYLCERIAGLAESADHHPDILLTYPLVKIELTTHDSGGITIRDIELAKKINSII
ncbi:MAG: 4a-hydroxytetrahydrobiopterin dehydratase [Chloroherpetonaceae bacterium]|nr:4a-hydroxytetrahydrobiopterin dehydratase [Chloroherpetonaceae bacterium]